MKSVYLAARADVQEAVAHLKLVRDRLAVHRVLVVAVEVMIDLFFIQVIQILIGANI